MNGRFPFGTKDVLQAYVLVFKQELFAWQTDEFGGTKVRQSSKSPQKICRSSQHRDFCECCLCEFTAGGWQLFASFAELILILRQSVNKLVLWQILIWLADSRINLSKPGCNSLPRDLGKILWVSEQRSFCECFNYRETVSNNPQYKFSTLRNLVL